VPLPDRNLAPERAFPGESGEAEGMSARLILVVAGWSAGWWLAWRIPNLTRPKAPPSPSPGSADCTVVIPARDEAGALPLLLADLARQQLRPRQVVVVDDESADGTAGLAEAFDGVTVIRGTPKPPGWAGKQWACAQGAAVAEAHQLVFLDADVRLASSAIGALVAAHGRSGGLLSVLPYHDVRRPYEQLSALFNLVTLMGVGAARPRRAEHADGAFGPCIVCRRCDYESVGGHGSIRDSVVDDLALARRFDDQALPVRATTGGPLVAFRMYPAGLRSLAEGWSKNIVTGAGRIPPGRSLAIAVWVTAMLSSVLLAVDAARQPSMALAAVAAATYLAFVLQQHRQLRRLGRFGWGTAAAYPVMASAFVLLFVRSLWLTLVRRRVRWKGRTIETPRRRVTTSESHETGAD
jgi:4,4'-diaponeurosporenoate glycosyltransferase